MERQFSHQSGVLQFWWRHGSCPIPSASLGRLIFDWNEQIKRRNSQSVWAQFKKTWTSHSDILGYAIIREWTCCVCCAEGATGDSASLRNHHVRGCVTRGNAAQDRPLRYVMTSHERCLMPLCFSQQSGLMHGVVIVVYCLHLRRSQYLGLFWASHWMFITKIHRINLFNCSFVKMQPFHWFLFRKLW